MIYTERVDGFQIRDITYVGAPPKHAAPQFDVVRWWKEPKPHVGTVCSYVNGRIEAHEGVVVEYCYSVGTLTWDTQMEEFEFHSVGTRWLQENPSEEVIQMILDFVKEKTRKFTMGRKGQ